MSAFNNKPRPVFNNNNQNAPAPVVVAAKAEQPNKVKFSSVKLGQTKQGSNTVGLYLKKEEMQKFVALMNELDEAGEDGCKVSIIVIEGEKYDSGYAYVNPKEPKQGSNNNGYAQAAASNNNNRFGKKPGNNDNKASARAFLQSKRIDDSEETEKGN